MGTLPGALNLMLHSGRSRIQKRGVLEMTVREVHRKFLHDHAHFYLAMPIKLTYNNAMTVVGGDLGKYGDDEKIQDHN